MTDISVVQMQIPVAVSARHVHLRYDTINRVFGPGYQLHFHAALSQTGQYAARETVTLVGPRGRIEHVRVVGPPRAKDQIEISRTDELTLGIDAPFRESGRLGDTPGIVIEGPMGSVTVEHGVICALRHVHMSPTDANRFGVRDQDLVQVAIGNGSRKLIFGDVVVRVSPNYRLELHLDTDEANAAGVERGTTAMLVAG